MASPDTSMFYKVKNKADFDRENEEFNLKKQLAKAALVRAESGGSTPAALQLANEYQTAVQSGDYDRAANIAQFAKIYDRGVVPTAGGVGSINDYGRAVGDIEAAKKGMGQQAEKDVDLVMNPQIKAAESRASSMVDRENTAIKKNINADEMMRQMERAKVLLPKATDSGMGALVAGGKQFFGISDEKTQSDRELELIGGWLVSNVPRMEGPQSNFDVQNYQRMAADVGNKTLPQEDRMAALNGLMALQQKYATPQGGQLLQPNAMLAPPLAAPQSMPQGGGVIDYTEYFK
jgi:hypothetical protein